MNFKEIIKSFKQVVPTCDFWSLRLVESIEETLNVREDVVQPPRQTHSRGAHITALVLDCYAVIDLFARCQ